MTTRALIRIPMLAPLLAAAALGAAALGGCSSGSRDASPSHSDARSTARSGGSHALRDSAQVAEFVRDVASGDRARWTLDAGATPAARRAWSNSATTKTIGIELRFGQAPWGCMELSMLRHGASTHEAVLVAKRRGGATLSANQIAVEYVRFSSAELADIIDAVCAGEPL